VPAVREDSTEDGGNRDSDDVSEAGEEEEGEESADTNDSDDVVREGGDEGECDGDEKVRNVTSERRYCPSGRVSWARKPKPMKSIDPHRTISRVSMAIIDAQNYLNFLHREHLRQQDRSRFQPPRHFPLPSVHSFPSPKS
jgi:hypothetical protein